MLLLHGKKGKRYKEQTVRFAIDSMKRQKVKSCGLSVTAAKQGCILIVLDLR